MGRKRDTSWYSIGPPPGRRGQTGRFLAACAAAAAVLLFLGWLALGWSQWRAFLSSACITIAALLLTVSVVEIALEYQRSLRVRPLRDELLRRLLSLVVEVLGDVSVVIGQPVLITNRLSEDLTSTARSLQNHMEGLFFTRIPRFGSQVPQDELDHYVKCGQDAAALVQNIDPLISSQIVPLLAAMDEDAELLRRSLRLAVAIRRQPTPLTTPSASEALSYMLHLVKDANNVLDRLQTLYEQDPAWRTVFEEGDIIVS